MALFESQAEEVVRRMTRKVKADGRRALKETYDLAIDYAENRQIDDVRNELNARYESAQEADAGQAIQPVTVPMTERYLAEAATVYSNGCTRTLTMPDGTETDDTRKQTKALEEMLEEARYGDTMQRNDELAVLLKTSPLLYESKRGKLRASIKFPQDVYPIAPNGPQFLDVSDPDDYAGFLIELYWASEDVTREQERTFLLLTNAEQQYWVGKAPDELEHQIGDPFPNPYEWNQTIEEIDPVDGTRTLHEDVMRPGRMLTFWHSRMPLGELIVETDVDVVDANRELNIAWSVLLDTIKGQGFAVPVITQTASSDRKVKRKYGWRHPLVLKVGETFSLANGAVNFSDQVQVLQRFVKMMAVMKSQSPNDFSLETQAAMSGFAKIVDALPKLEAREKRIVRAAHMERHVAWPRLRAIGQHLGKLDKTTDGMVLRVKFGDVEVPRNPDEESKHLETQFKYNFTTPAHILARREGISLEQAKEQLIANRELNAELRPAPAPQPGFGNQPPGQFPQGAQGGSRFPAIGSLIARTNRSQPPPGQQQQQPPQGNEQGDDDGDR